MNVKVLVQTTDGVSVVGGIVSLQPRDGAPTDVETDKSGIANASPSDAPFTLTVRHPDFVTQITTVSRRGAASDQSSSKVCVHRPQDYLGTIVS
jgi:hypothetical protein